MKTKDKILKGLKKEFLKHLDAESEEELKDALYDIVRRANQPSKMGVYSPKFLGDQLYIYFYCMWHKWRNQFQEMKKKEIKKSHEDFEKMIDEVFLKVIEKRMVIIKSRDKDDLSVRNMANLIDNSKKKAVKLFREELKKRLQGK